MTETKNKRKWSKANRWNRCKIIFKCDFSLPKWSKTVTIFLTLSTYPVPCVRQNTVNYQSFYSFWHSFGKFFTVSRFLLLSKQVFDSLKQKRSTFPGFLIFCLSDRCLDGHHEIPDRQITKRATKTSPNIFIFIENSDRSSKATQKSTQKSTHKNPSLE